MNQDLCGRAQLRAVAPVYEFHSLNDDGELTGCKSRTEAAEQEPQSFYCEGCRQHFDRFEAALEHLPSAVESDERELGLARGQVKALLDITAADTLKPELRRLAITTYEGAPYLTATDGYVLVALRLASSYASEVGKCVPREEIVRWHKLAETKDLFNDLALKRLLVRNDMAFPCWEQVVPSDTQAVDRLCFNATYASKLQAVACQPITYRMTGERGALVGQDDKGMYILMPCKA